MINKILVITNTIDAGGAETFVMKLFRCIDRSKYIFDFPRNLNFARTYDAIAPKRHDIARVPTARIIVFKKYLPIFPTFHAVK